MIMIFLFFFFIYFFLKTPFIALGDGSKYLRAGKAAPIFSLGK